MKVAYPWRAAGSTGAGWSAGAGGSVLFATDQPLYASDVNAKAGQTSVGSTITGATGFTLQFQEKMTDQLYQDLSSDRNMSWVQRDSWFTYLNLMLQQLQ